MKLIALCLFAFTCYSVIESAPVREELLQNIEDAAEAKVEKEESKAAKYNAQADTEEAQLAANTNFAQDLAEKVEFQNEVLARMSSEEKKTIADAKAIEDDSKSEDTSDIAVRDMDAEDKSQEIQQNAEQVDTALLASMEAMRSVGIEGEKKAAILAGKKAAQLTHMSLGVNGDANDEEDDDDSEEDDQDDNDEFVQKVKLGEARFPHVDEGTYKERLTAIEDDAHKMVDQSKADEQTAEERVQKADKQLNTMVGMASTGMAALKESEARLHRDLNGHRDKQLEKDIETRVGNIDSNNKLGENDDPLVAAEEAAEAAAVPAEEQLDTSSDYDDTVTRTQQEAAERETEEPTAHFAADEDFAANEEEQMGKASESALESQETQHATAKSSSYNGNLAAIKSDAEQLVDYQENSLKEIAAIAKPLLPENDS